MGKKASKKSSRKATGKRYTFLLNFGYAESAMLSYMPWNSRGLYKDARSALVDLAEYLKAQYNGDNGSQASLQCCVTSRKHNNNAKFCSECGRDLRGDEFDPESFATWLYSLGCISVNDMSDFVECGADAPWEPGLDSPNFNPLSVYNAEYVICAALGYPRHKDKTFEYVCRGRGAAGAFTYY
jgi:hypothetical protein